MLHHLHLSLEIISPNDLQNHTMVLQGFISVSLIVKGCKRPLLILLAKTCELWTEATLPRGACGSHRCLKRFFQYGDLMGQQQPVVAVRIAFVSQINVTFEEFWLERPQSHWNDDWHYNCRIWCSKSASLLLSVLWGLTLLVKWLKKVL